MIFRKIQFVDAVRAAPVAAVAMAVLIPLIGCSNAVKHGPSFPPTGLTILVGSQPIDRLDLIDGRPIDPITLPKAMGGSGEFTYSLTPEVPGLTFDPATRTWSGTPVGARTAVRTHELTYAATDADGASVSVEFTVTVRPTLWGTWRSVSTWRDWRDDDRIIGERVETLTFTSDRYILHKAHYDLNGDLSNSYGSDSGTWTTPTDSTITRTWLHDDDDDDATPEVRRNVVKDYLWADEDRSTLMVHFWDYDDETREFQAFKRVDTALPPPLAGTWTTTLPDEGDLGWTIIVREDGTITVRDEDVPWTKTVKWTLDQDRYSLELTDASDVEWEGARIAFAPTDQYPDGIVVSFPWYEAESEYGRYWDVLTRRK